MSYGVAPYGSEPFGAAPDYVPAAVEASRSNITILSPIRSDAATLVASSEVETLPVANLQNMQPKRKWRSLDLAPSITIDLGRDVACNAFALVGHNFTSVATIRIRGKLTADVTVNPTVDTGAITVWPGAVKPDLESWPQFTAWAEWNNDIALRYWRVDIDDGTNADGYVQAGRLMLGPYWQPISANFDLGGVPLARDQKDVQTVTDYGDIFTDRRSRSAPRRFQLQISAADRSEVLGGIAEIQRLRGMWGDVVVLLDPSEVSQFHNWTMQGVFTAPQEHSIVPLFNSGTEMWSVNFPLREVP